MYLYLSIYLSLFLSVSLPSFTRLFLNINCADCNCVHHMQPQAMGSSPQSASIIGLFVRPVVCKPFAVFVFLLISSVGIQSCDACIPTMGSWWTQWGSVEIIFLSVGISISSPGHLHHFLVIICVARNCVQCMRPQTTGWNPLSGIIICPSVCPSGPPRAFCNFFILY